MRSTDDIRLLLDQLETTDADSLEAQDLDFKQWIDRSMRDSVSMVVEMAVCMANGGGGTVVLGVRDRAVGRAEAILGVPNEVEVTQLRRSIYDQTDPKLTPLIEELRVPEGTGRILVMHVYPGLPPYTDTKGLAKIRIGKDCKPLTGSLRADLVAGSGQQDFTAGVVEGDWRTYVSATALENLRDLAGREQAPKELLGLSDEDLLRQLRVLDGERGLTKAGLLLAGSEDAIRAGIPDYLWTFLRMETDTRYRDRKDSHAALPIALVELEERIALDNPITTVEHGLVHAELRAYPPVALREALLNALCHVDFRLPGPILVKHFSRRLEMSNPGAFVGGINEGNILHHPPVPRNPLLVDALARLRLVNRSNLGIGRMFEAFLVEGKEPPVIREQGETIVATFLHQQPSGPFRAFVAAQGKKQRVFGVDELLILNHLARHSEATTTQLAELCQRPEQTLRETLSRLEREDHWIERGGTGKGTYWKLNRKTATILAPKAGEETARIDWEAAKTRVLSTLKRRAKDSDSKLTNTDIRRITSFDRRQVVRLMKELAKEHPEIQQVGERRTAGYVFDLTLTES